MAQEKWIIAPGESRIIDLELVRRLKVGLIGGQVDIIGHDEPGARIEVGAVTGKDLKITIDGDVAEIDHPQLRWDNFLEVFSNFGANRATAQVSVLVPRDIALTFGVVSASGLVAGLTADAKLNTVSGDLVADRMTGRLDLNSVSGELTVQHHTGRIQAHTVSGDVTVSGDITRASIDGVSSDLLLDIHGACEQLDLNTVSGAITVRLDEELAARYTANSVGGRLAIDGVVLKGLRGGGYNAHTGALSGQFAEVRMNTVGGAVTVLRRPAAEPTGAATTAGSEAGA
jgi:hypothetical protein